MNKDIIYWEREKRLQIFVLFLFCFWLYSSYIDIVIFYRNIREAISGAKAAMREAIPCPTWGSNLRVCLKYPNGSSVFTSINFL